MSSAVDILNSKISSFNETNQHYIKSIVDKREYVDYEIEAKLAPVANLFKSSSYTAPVTVTRDYFQSISINDKTIDKYLDNAAGFVEGLTDKEKEDVSKKIESYQAKDPKIISPEDHTEKTEGESDMAYKKRLSEVVSKRNDKYHDLLKLIKTKSGDKTSSYSTYKVDVDKQEATLKIASNLIKEKIKEYGKLAQVYDDNKVLIDITYNLKREYNSILKSDTIDTIKKKISVFEKSINSAKSVIKSEKLSEKKNLTKEEKAKIEKDLIKSREDTEKKIEDITKKTEKITEEKLKVEKSKIELEDKLKKSKEKIEKEKEKLKESHKHFLDKTISEEVDNELKAKLEEKRILNEQLGKIDAANPQHALILSKLETMPQNQYDISYRDVLKKKKIEELKNTTDVSFKKDYEELEKKHKEEEQKIHEEILNKDQEIKKLEIEKTETIENTRVELNGISPEKLAFLKDAAKGKSWFQRLLSNPTALLIIVIVFAAIAIILVLTWLFFLFVAMMLNYSYQTRYIKEAKAFGVDVPFSYTTLLSRTALGPIYVLYWLVKYGFRLTPKPGVYIQTKIEKTPETVS